MTAGPSWTTVSSTFSRGAAQRLGVIGKGTARVRIQSLGDVPQVEDGDVVRGTFFVRSVPSPRRRTPGPHRAAYRQRPQGPHDLWQQQPLERAGGPVGRFPQGRRDDARAACPVPPTPSWWATAARARRLPACNMSNGPFPAGNGPFFMGMGMACEGERAPLGKGSPFLPQTPPILPETFLLGAWPVSIAVRQGQHRARPGDSLHKILPLRHGGCFLSGEDRTDTGHAGTGCWTVSRNDWLNEARWGGGGTPSRQWRGSPSLNNILWI